MSLLESMKPMHDNVPLSHSSYPKRHLFLDVDNLVEWGKPWIYQYFPKPTPIRTHGLESGPMGSWDSRMSMAWGTVLYDEGRFRYWGIAMPDPEGYDDQNVDICLAAYAESEDGINWVKPDLGLVAQQRWPGNNLLPMPGVICSIVRPLPSAGCKFLAMVVATGAPTSYERTEIYGEDVFEYNGPGTYLMASDDGLHWRQFTKNPILLHGDMGTLHVDHLRQRYIMHHKCGAMHGLSMRRSTITIESPDGIHWDGYHGYRQWHETVCDDYDDLLSAQHGRYHAEFYGCGAIHQVDSLYLTLQTIFMVDMPIHARSGQNPYGHAVQRLAFSHDGINWRYPKGRPLFQEPEPAGLPNCGFMETTSGIIEKDDEMYIYTTAHRRTHCYGITADFKLNPEMAFDAMHGSLVPYLLRIKRDRFAALASNHPTTFDVEVGPRQGTELTVNFITRGTGSVRVALAEQSSPYHLEPRKHDSLPGFSFADCIPMSGDQVKARVRFKNASIANIPKEMMLTLRVEVDAGEVYGYEWTS